MSIRTVCDFCEEAINGTPKVSSTEADGQKLDFCTTTCFMNFTRGTGASL